MKKKRGIKSKGLTLKNYFFLLFVEIGIFLTVFIFGVLLIRSVRQEVRQREKLESITKQLENANVRLKELDKEKTLFLSIASHQLKQVAVWNKCPPAQPSANPRSAMAFSICLIVTGSLLMPSTQAASHGAGQTRPVNSGKLLVE